MNEDELFKINCKQSVATFSRTLTWDAVMHQFGKNIQRLLAAADRQIIRRYSSKGKIWWKFSNKLSLAYAEGGWRQIRGLVTQKLISIVKLK